MNNQFVADLITAAGGEIVGRTRLQKIVYLLDQVGQESGLHFEYHYYGPYSEELSNQVDFEKYIESSLHESVRERAHDGAKYSVFSSSTGHLPDRIGKLSTDEAKRYLGAFQKKSSTVLELAATIHWLIAKEKIANWQEELRIRKGGKTENGRMEEAIELLEQLDIMPNHSSIHL